MSERWRAIRVKMQGESASRRRLTRYDSTGGASDVLGNEAETQ